MSYVLHPLSLPKVRMNKNGSEDYGWAKFAGYAESVFVHRSDVDELPARGDALIGTVVRKRNGKLQAFYVRKAPVEDADERLHATLLGGVA